MLNHATDTNVLNIPLHLCLHVFIVLLHKPSQCDAAL